MRISPRVGGCKALKGNSIIKTGVKKETVWTDDMCNESSSCIYTTETLKAFLKLDVDHIKNNKLKILNGRKVLYINNEFFKYSKFDFFM